MSVIVSLHHATRYRYDRPIALGPQIIRLRPAPHSRTRIPSYSLKVTPAEHFVNWQQNPSGNWLAHCVFPEKTTELSITVDLVADMEVINPFDFFVEPEAEQFPFKYADELSEKLSPYLVADPRGPLLEAFLALIPREKRNTVDFLVDLNQRLQRKIRYIVRMEPGLVGPLLIGHEATTGMRPMAIIVLKCRYSGNYVLTGLRTENAPTMVGGRVTCPYCAAEHVWIAATDDNDRANHKP